jgi:hypothetical protein
MRKFILTTAAIAAFAFTTVAQADSLATRYLPGGIADPYHAVDRSVGMSADVLVKTNLRDAALAFTTVAPTTSLATRYLPGGIADPYHAVDRSVGMSAGVLVKTNLRACCNSKAPSFVERTVREEAISNAGGGGQ